MTKWTDHVKAFRKAHPNMSYKDALKAASPSYKKVQKGGMQNQNNFYAIYDIQRLVDDIYKYEFSNAEDYDWINPMKFRAYLENEIAEGIQFSLQHMAGDDISLSGSLLAYQFNARGVDPGAGGLPDHGDNSFIGPDGNEGYEYMLRDYKR